MDLTRHEWGDVHFWIAVSLVVLILLHLVIHSGWIAGAARHYFRMTRLRQPAAATV